MEVIKETKSPTGWGIAYENIDTVFCKIQTAAGKVYCSLEAEFGKEKVDLIADKAEFEDLDKVIISDLAVLFLMEKS
jgi:hypothetical protein